MHTVLREGVGRVDGATLDLDAIYRAHAPRVARWVARLGGPSADVEDLMHEVFVVAERRLPEFRGDGALTTWLYRVTANVVRHQRRKNRLRSWLLGNEVMEDRLSDAPLQDEALARKRDVELLYGMLDKLSEKYRTVLILHEIEGMTGPEIAELTGTKVSTVWVQLHRAKAKLAAQVKGRAR